MLKIYFLLPIFGAVTFIVYCVIDMQLSIPVYRRKTVVKENSTKIIKKPRTSLVFLKTHKCASSTVQNIIMRFGFKRGLYFVLPYSGNYLGNPPLFNYDLINAFATPRNKKFDIFAHHTRYNGKAIKGIMKTDAAFVTILRDPADLFESLFTFYENSFKSYNITFDRLIRTRNVTGMKREQRTRYGINQMLFDLGMDELYFNSDILVNKYIKKIDLEFDLVMIAEYMEASLVLFADLMKWRLEDVVYLSLNSRNQTRKRHLTLHQRKSLHEINRGDWLLYNYFLNRLRKRIIDYGKDRFMVDVNRLINLNMYLKRDCVSSINEKGYARTISYTLSNGKWLCVYAAMNELMFTNQIRDSQVQRLDIIKKIKFLVDN